MSMDDAPHPRRPVSQPIGIWLACTRATRRSRATKDSSRAAWGRGPSELVPQDVLVLEHVAQVLGPGNPSRGTDRTARRKLTLLPSAFPILAAI
jgi:hypothetical protein